MNFERFTEEMKKRMEAAHPDVTVQLGTVKKNNGKRLSCLHVGNTVHGSICPCLYLDELFHEDMSEEDMNNAFSVLQNAYSEALKSAPHVVDIGDVTCMQENIFYHLVNADRNKELLETHPHIIWEDLAIVFRCRVPSDEQECASFLISEHIMNHWGMTVEDLLENAKENTPRIFPYKLSSLADVLNLPVEGTDMPIYVATNRLGINGANVLLYDDVLQEFAEKCGTGFYVLPSSIHEVLFVPDCNDEQSADFLSEMVKDVNANVVSLDEILSDNVYYYNKELNKLKIA